MGILDFILGLIAVIVFGGLILLGICLHFDTRELEQNNEKLKQEIKKLKLLKSSLEYKKVKEVKNGK